MRRTLALALAVPVVLVLTAPIGTSSADTGATPNATPAVIGPPSAMPAVERPDVEVPRAARPVDDETASTGAAAPDAEGTVDATDDGRPGAGPGPAAGAEPGPEEPGPEEPAASMADGPVEDTFLIAAVPESGAVAGSGPRWRYTIEVDPGLGIDPDIVATEVRAALTDERSWVRTRTLEQVDDPGRARIRVVLASPDIVDELCGRVGLRTAGIYSCWNGRFAALNSWRWEVGADAFTDITTYRNYLVNHEFGHGLGYGHVGCPGPGEPAPVMVQQSKGVGDCVANGWPYP